MNEFVVNTKPELVAAIKAGAEETFDAAKRNPFQVTLGTAVYTFKEGLHVRRSREIIRNIHRTPAAAFRHG